MKLEVDIKESNCFDVLPAVIVNVDQAPSLPWNCRDGCTGKAAGTGLAVCRFGNAMDRMSKFTWGIEECCRYRIAGSFV